MFFGFLSDVPQPMFAIAPDRDYVRIARASDDNCCALQSSKLGLVFGWNVTFSQISKFHAAAKFTAAVRQHIVHIAFR